MAERFGARVHDSYARLLDDERIDAVYIALPPALHCEWASAALRAGKHVLCEKPLALSAGEVAEMAAAAGDADRLLVEGLMWRYGARIRRLRELLAAGAIGELRYIRIRYGVRSRGLDDAAAAASTFRFSAALGGGAIGDLGCYCVDALTMICEGAPVRVDARSAVPAGSDVETAFDARLEFSNGVVAQLLATMESAAGSEIEILGTGGSIRIPAAFRVRAADAPLELHVVDGNGRRMESTGFEDLYRLEFERFADAVLEGASPAIPLGDSWRTASVVDAIRRSCAAQQVASFQ